MIRLDNLKCGPQEGKEGLERQIRRVLRIRKGESFHWHILKRSLDARRKPRLFYVYSVAVEGAQEGEWIRRAQGRALPYTPVEYTIPEVHKIQDFVEIQRKSTRSGRPIVIGSGPAGLFCTYVLARAGLCPLLLERGAPVRERLEDVERFWRTGILDLDSNVQFGEGGAGTFSDGKLNSGVKDTHGRGRFILETFVRFGADPDILIQGMPHIGTDVLIGILEKLRLEIQALGATVRFHSKVTELLLDKEKGGVQGVRLAQGEEVFGEQVVLAIGHSARDTFSMLHRLQLPMEPKAFAVGLRVEHLQETIDLSQYGQPRGTLPPAPYKLAYTPAPGSGVYSFCMCPGGYVVNASSEAGRLAVNGMSYHGRAGKNANSAIVVTVSPQDYGARDCLDGVAFQRALEAEAFARGQGRIPVQRLEDFRACKGTRSFGQVSPQTRGGWEGADLRGLLPGRVEELFLLGMERFGKQIQGFDHPDTLLFGVESRTSSPLRILRDSSLESPLKGLFPCGEGAGYAGGIFSAALDGIKVAEEIIRRQGLAPESAGSFEKGCSQKI